MNRRAPVEVKIHRSALEDVRERQEAEHDIAFFDRQHLAIAEHIGDDVVMCEHDALRLARGAGGINQRRQITRFHAAPQRLVQRGLRLIGLAATPQQFVEVP